MFRINRFLNLQELIFFKRLSVVLLFLLTVQFFPIPVNAHHPFEGTAQSFTSFQGFVSGIAHPLLGLDHFIFLLSIGIAGFCYDRRWILSLLGTGLIGSLLGASFSQIPGAEVLVAVSIIFSAFVALGKLNFLYFFPFIFAHGYVLSGVIVGAESTPLLAYVIGLLFSEALLITIGQILFKNFSERRNILAGILMGAGIVLTYGVFVV